MDYAVISVAAAPLRKKPNHKREMVSQLLFGEAVALINNRGKNWIKIRGLHDVYEGWLTKNHFNVIDEHQARVACPFVSTELLSPVVINERTLNIPVGSTLYNLENGNGNFGDIKFSFSGPSIDRFQQRPSPELLSKFTSPWMNVPYMWGGRTPLGVDCSGFVQITYKMMGIDLPRDAWQQAQEGKAVKKLKDSATGDLVFFDDKDEIVHVGILLNQEQIIHASGRVRIDTIDKKGIINTETNRRTHRLELIRRVW
jgi:gamma-D-glutamyl-L-lysine dipeptidyl-peptidase